MTRVLLADDSVILRQGLGALLARLGFEIVGEAGTADELMALVARTSPDVALVDVRMPPTYRDEGVRAARDIADLHPDVGVLILSQHVAVTYAMQLLERRTRGSGYLLKDHVPDIETLAGAVRTVAAGGCYVDGAVVQRLLERERRVAPLRGLSDRELETLTLMAEGRSNRAICERLFLSPKTVETHVRRIFEKLELPQAADDHRRVLAVLRFLNAD